MELNIKLFKVNGSCNDGRQFSVGSSLWGTLRSCLDLALIQLGHIDVYISLYCMSRAVSSWLLVSSFCCFPCHFSKGSDSPPCRHVSQTNTRFVFSLSQRTKELIKCFKIQYKCKGYSKCLNYSNHVHLCTSQLFTAMSWIDDYFHVTSLLGINLKHWHYKRYVVKRVVWVITLQCD